MYLIPFYEIQKLVALNFYLRQDILNLMQYIYIYTFNIDNLFK